MTPVGTLLEKGRPHQRRGCFARIGSAVPAKVGACWATCTHWCVIANVVVSIRGHRKGVPTLNPLNYRVPENVLQLLPPEFVVEHEMMPVDRMGPMMTVVMLYPLGRKCCSSCRKPHGTSDKHIPLRFG